jgi:hypothetical protein
MFKMRVFFLLVFCTVAAMSGALLAQSTFATMTGTVTDPQGSIVPGVTVAVTNVDTGIETSTITNDAGIYTMATLKEGTYTLRANLPGFREFVVGKLTLSSRDYRSLNIRLEIGEITNSIEVTGGATLIEAETSRIGENKTAEQFKLLPQNWFRFSIYYLALTPNVTQGDDGSYRFAGSRINQAQYSVDGTTVDDGDGSMIGSQYSYTESIQEMRTGVVNNGAEFGTLGQATIISKSGTNRLHGSVFDYYVTPYFRARNPFLKERDPGISHFPGFSLGGPVFLPKLYDGRNKTFFFTSYETSRGSSTTTFLNPTVPLEAWRQGNFSGISEVIRDPVTGEPFAGNLIPQNRLNSVALKMQERFYPLPNWGDPGVFTPQNYRENKARPWDPVSMWNVRGDHSLTEKDAIYGRLTWTRGTNRYYDGNLPAIGRLNKGQRDTRSVTLSWAHVLAPNMTNESRYGLVFNNTPYEGNVQGKELMNDLGIVGLAPDVPDITGILRINWNGTALQPIAQTNYTTGYRNFSNQFQDHFSWLRGRHNIKFGGTITRSSIQQYSAPNCLFGCATFSNRFTGFPYADFLLGYPTQVERAFPPAEVYRVRNAYDFYVMDDLKLTPRLTVNVGIRYEYHPYWNDPDGLGSMFDLASGKIVVPDGSLSKVSPLFPRNYVDIVEAGSIGLPGATLIRGDRNNFAPRLGLAYRPGNDSTVISAGFGVYFDSAPRNINFAGSPYVLNEPAYPNPATNPTVIFPRIWPEAAPGQQITSVNLPAAVNPDLNIPYSLQYNLTLQHARWDTSFRLSYIGTATRQGEWAYNANSPVPDARPYIEKSRPFPQYPGINYYTNGAGHQYNALTTEVERPLAKGLGFQSAWVWARDIGDLSRGQVAENPFDRARERSVSSDVPTHRFNTNFIYRLPVGKGESFLSGASRALDLVVGGWELAGNFTAATGRFLTPDWCGPDLTGTAHTTSSTAPSPCRRPDMISDPNLPASERTLERWFDPTAFVPAPIGRFGNSAKGVIKAPGTNFWNATFAKNFRFKEDLRFRVEMMARNLFNHPNWSAPATRLSSGTAGRISNAEGNWYDFSQVRQFRLGLRLEW